MGPPHAHHPRALTCARRLRPTRPLRSTAAAGIRSQVLSLRPRPLPPPAGAPCLSSGRHGAPDAAAGGGAGGPGSPRAERRGGGGEMRAGEGAARLCPKPGADPATGPGGAPLPARTLTPTSATWGRGRVSVASDARPRA